MTIPLVDIGTGGISADECKYFEKSFEHIPNIKSLLDGPTASSSYSFSWAHRRLLIEQPYKSIASAKSSEVYLIYMSRESETGLAPNEYLNKLVGELSLSCRARMREEFEAYGDAFVFRMKVNGLSGGRAEYVDMPKTFIPGPNGVADIVLRWLVTNPWGAE